MELIYTTKAFNKLYKEKLNATNATKLGLLKVGPSQDSWTSFQSLELPIY